MLSFHLYILPGLLPSSLNSIPCFCLSFASDFTVISVGCGMGYVITWVSLLCWLHLLHWGWLQKYLDVVLVYISVAFLKLFLLVLACSWFLMLMLSFQGPSRLVAEEGKSKCAWVTLDDVTNRFIRGEFTCGHIIRTIVLMSNSSVLCAVKNHHNPNLLEKWWLQLNCSAFSLFFDLVLG